MRELTKGHSDLYLQRKLSLAGEMKTAIKRFLEDWTNIDTVVDSRIPNKRVNELRKAMENYLNCESETVDSNS